MRSCFATLAFAAALATCALAHAQQPPAIGDQGPEPAPARIVAEMKTGTISVRVVAGDHEKPLTGVDVSLRGAGRIVARTDGAGLVTFEDVAPADSYQVFASVTGATLESDVFSLPSSGGVSVLLTTKPMAARAGPRARNMSGQARPDEAVKVGGLRIRGLQGELFADESSGLKSEIPMGSKIHLVGFNADGTMGLESQELSEDEGGRVLFTKLARDHQIAYYALASFPRLGGTDRLMSEVIRLAPESGSVMALVGAASDSASSPIDDLAKKFGGAQMPGPGNVSVRLFAHQNQGDYLSKVSTVELVDLSKQDKPISVPATISQADAAGQSGEASMLEDTKPGEVSFYVVRPSQKAVIAGVTIRIERVPTAPVTPDVPATPPLELTTNDDGLVYAKNLDPAIEYVAIASYRGGEARSPTFRPDPTQGKTMAFGFEWPDQEIRSGEFTGVSSGADTVYVAKVMSKGRQFLSVPFQLTPNKGALVAIFMYPEIIFSFDGGAEVDDNRLWFQQRFTLYNPSVAPRDVGDGLTIPLPKGHVGASVPDNMTRRVGVVRGEGLLWRGAVPPGQRNFMVSYALPIEEGEVIYDLTLPYGIQEGRVVVPDLPGLELRTTAGLSVVKHPPKASGNHPGMPGGTGYFEMTEIERGLNQRLFFAVSNLPHRPAWHSQARTGLGLATGLLACWALFAIFFQRADQVGIGANQAKLVEQKEALLTQLGKLEAEFKEKRIGDKPYQKKRKRLRGQLEGVYEELDSQGAAA